VHVWNAFHWLVRERFIERAPPANLPPLPPPSKAPPKPKKTNPKPGSSVCVRVCVCVCVCVQLRMMECAWFAVGCLPAATVTAIAVG
jgi:hypothetical protein